MQTSVLAFDHQIERPKPKDAKDKLHHSYWENDGDPFYLVRVVVVQEYLLQLYPR